MTARFELNAKTRVMMVRFELNAKTRVMTARFELNTITRVMTVRFELNFYGMKDNNEIETKQWQWDWTWTYSFQSTSIGFRTLHSFEPGEQVLDGWHGFVHFCSAFWQAIFRHLTCVDKGPNTQTILERSYSLHNLLHATVYSNSLKAEILHPYRTHQSCCRFFKVLFGHFAKY